MQSPAQRFTSDQLVLVAGFPTGFRRAGIAARLHRGRDQVVQRSAPGRGRTPFQATQVLVPLPLTPLMLGPPGPPVNPSLELFPIPAPFPASRWRWGGSN